MNAKHTSGPWTVTKTGDVTDMGGTGIGRVRLFNRDNPLFLTDGTQAPVDEIRSESRANARLIASAPDLLAALEPLAAWAENERRAHRDRNEENEAEYMGKLADDARAAIAKAKGE